MALPEDLGAPFSVIYSLNKMLHRVYSEETLLSAGFYPPLTDFYILTSRLSSPVDLFSCLG